jgi:CRISPR/Cas system CMR subunit Cmr4 (Cas7 group RAMP superfamily)
MLFNEETVPAETLFYVSLTDLSRNDKQTAEIEKVFKHFETDQLLQFGGNATTGLGFCTTTLKKEDA